VPDLATGGAVKLSWRSKLRLAVVLLGSPGPGQAQWWIRSLGALPGMDSEAETGS
jgi:hypothetical protein